MPTPEASRDDLRAAVAARQELGADYEPQIVDSFLDQVSQQIDARVDARVDARAGHAGGSGMDSGPRIAVAIVSLGSASR